MFLYNTLSGKKNELEQPLNGRVFNLFVCGPTVYDYAHLGHARTYIFFDTLVRYLRYQKKKVFYLQNITNIDDKIIERAKQENKNPLSLSRHFEKEYKRDMRALGIKTVDRYARASDYISQIKNQIKKLLKGGVAYSTSQGIYFSVKKFKDYGKLSGQNIEALRAGWRIEPDPEKKDPMDFALWKFSKNNEPAWNSPWGKGRPGWHIEDTAITEKFFGPQYDLHGGGMDLKFPHHEAEIAQEETISQRKPLARIWLHTGFMLVGGEKMSKSLGNFITIRDFLKKWPAAVLRTIFLQHHYRSPIDYSPVIAQQAENALLSILEFLTKLDLTAKNNAKKSHTNREIIKKAEEKFNNALNDDLNTPEALAVLFELINQHQKTVWGMSREDINAIKNFLIQSLDILGIYFQVKIPFKIRRLAKKRELFRKNKQFIQSDALRENILALGYKVEDTNYGPQITPARLSR